MAVAAALAVGVLAAACSADSPDAGPASGEPPAAAAATLDTPPDTAAANAGEPDDSDTAAANAGEPDDSDSDTAAANAGEPVAASAAESSAEPADLGAFNGYEPGEPDPTLLGIDADVRVGVLDNGFSYYLRSNGSPVGHVAMRLVVKAGAVLDPPGQEGVAHFLKHMLYKGTGSFPDEELGRVLRGLGAETDPDLGANTSPDETVYRLDFQLDDPAALDVAFMVLSQWASAAAIAPAAVEAERGIVLDEYRRRDEAANGWIRSRLDALYYTGTVYEGMLIVGSEESNSSITAEHLRDFYETWYRPDNMALVVVGDLAVADMAQRVERFFGGLASPAEPMPAQPERSASTADLADEPVVDVAVHPDFGYRSVRIVWQLPAWTPSTVGGDRLRWMEAIIGDLVDIRLASAHRAGLTAQADEPWLWLWQPTLGMRLYGTDIEGPDLQRATADYLSVLTGAAHYGFTAEELDRAIAAARTSLAAQLEREATIDSAEHAHGYYLSFVRGDGIESVEDRVARLGALLDTFTVEELTAHLRWILDHAPPLVMSLGDDPAHVPDAAQLRAAVDAAVPVPAPPAALAEVERDIAVDVVEDP